MLLLRQPGILYDEYCNPRRQHGERVWSLDHKWHGPGEGFPQGIRSHRWDPVRIKKALDTYEQFFDEYCAFMNRYSNSGYSPEMMGDYLAFLSKYQEAMDSLNRLDNQELNNSELLYYLEVTERITQKLTEVSL